MAGERGVVLGQQDGTFEAWVLPVKLLSHLTIEADVEGYNVPIDVNQQAAEIEVRPDRTVITYSHIGFTVRQIMFSPNTAPAGTGPVVLFEFDCLRPTDFILRFTPDLRWMWPERNDGVPGVEWVAPDRECTYRLPVAITSSTPITPTWPAPSPFPVRSQASSRPTRNGPQVLSRRAQAAHRPGPRSWPAVSAADGSRHEQGNRHQRGAGRYAGPAERIIEAATRHTPSATRSCSPTPPRSRLPTRRSTKPSSGR